MPKAVRTKPKSQHFQPYHIPKGPHDRNPKVYGKISEAEKEKFQALNEALQHHASELVKVSEELAQLSGRWNGKLATAVRVIVPALSDHLPVVRDFQPFSFIAAKWAAGKISRRLESGNVAKVEELLEQERHIKEVVDMLIYAAASELEPGNELEIRSKRVSAELDRLQESSRKVSRALGWALLPTPFIGPGVFPLAFQARAEYLKSNALRIERLKAELEELKGDADMVANLESSSQV